VAKKHKQRALRAISLRGFALAKLYLRRSHTTLGVAMNIISMAAIWFSLIPGVSEIFHGSFIIFAALFLPAIATAYLIFGRWDYRRGTYGYEQEEIAGCAPQTYDTFLCLAKLADAISSSAPGNPGVQRAAEAVRKTAKPWLRHKTPRAASKPEEEV